MSDTSSKKTIDLKWFGKLSLTQLLAIIAAFLIALILTLLGFGNSCYCFGMLVIAVILYMLPRLLGVENIKLMTLLGVVFAVCAILIGGLVMAPGFIDRNQEIQGNDYFHDVELTPTSGIVTINATVVLNDSSTDSVYFVYGEVKAIGFQGISVIFDTLSTPLHVTPDGSVAGDTTFTITDQVQLDSDHLYAGYLAIGPADASSVENLNGDTNTNWALMSGAHDGDTTSLSLFGSAYSTLMIMVVFFLIMILSFVMRGRMEKTRERMEKEGRLYPQGYGKCEKCGAVVLPGEVKCRKCGAYIDRPEEMKPNKKDFFECSECGAEVPSDAATCPKCGARFDEDEFEVTHADGTVETTNEVIACPECGEVAPAKATFCAKCGAKFNKK